ncbi:maleylacetoacetate isomerase [Breoghania sp. L-A4]|uniref:maleylacetoacetate isomerase n=1 Tax=Breoghania sp. L-A4 TaxID=2304600 RepID=UPI000E360061|nr:maleylacetoacetate isomerase [Breoghania sp. L-A4]AXS40318.1 maleylacetoacetate isomerase [Breoghania sp. L-A4]
MPRPVLHDYFRSSAAYRVRIALNLKGIDYTQHAVNLIRDGGEHLSDAYRAINPQARVPSLETADGDVLIQSPAILEWLEETHPTPPLLPAGTMARARIRAVAAIIACDIHPLNNLGVMGYLKGPLGCTQDAVNAWYAHWVYKGFSAIETLLRRAETSGPFAFGDLPTLADVYLVPQVFNARRFNVPLDAYPRIVAADAACADIPAFAKAHPSRQPDAV